MNKVTLIGNLTRDPELRTTQSGVSVCTFGLAVRRRIKAEGQPDADFFTITAWRQLGENCAKYLAKGRKAAVTGSVHLRTYDAQDGTKRTVADVQADEVEFLGSPSEAGKDSNVPAAPVVDTNGFTVVQEDDLPF